MMPSAISHTEISPDFRANHLVSERLLSSRKGAAPSIVVKGEAAAAAGIWRPVRTVAKSQNGLSVAETRIMSEAFHFMRRDRRPLVWLTLEAHDAGELALRNLADKLKSDFGQMQRRADGPRYSLEILEGECSVHSNVVGAVPVGLTAKSIIARLESSRVYGDGLNGQFVRDPDGLVNYLSKEATTQAHFAAGRAFRRAPGSHPLGEGGGDRVRLSRDLERDMIDAGVIEPRRRTYRSRSLKPKTTPERRQFTLIEGGQIELFAAKPVSRLHEFGGGLMPPTVAKEIRFRLGRLGMTQEQLARATLLGRPTITNALEGRFPLSEWAARRIRETLLPPRVPANSNEVVAA